MLRRALLSLSIASLCLAAGNPLMEEYNRAWQLVGQRRPDEAIPLLKSIIARDKTFHRAYRVLGEAYAQKNALDEAERYFQSLLTEDHRNGLADYGLAEAHSRKWHWAKAAEYYTSCIRRQPEACVCYIPLGETLAIANKYVLTMADIERRIAPGRDNACAYLAYTGAFSRRREISKARAAVQTGLQKAIELGDPELEMVFHKLSGGVLSTRGEGTVEALEHFRKALKLSQQLNDWDEEINLYHLLAGAALRLNDYETGLSYQERGLTRARELGHYEYMVGGSLYLGGQQAELGHFDSALQNFWDAEKLAIKAKDSLFAAGCLRRIAETYVEQGRFTEALKCADDALQMTIAFNESDDGFIYRLFGEIYGRQGDYFRALDQASESVRIFQKGGMRWQAGAGLHRIGTIYSDLGDYPTAMRYFRQSYASTVANEDKEDEQRVLVKLGNVALKMDRPGEALRYFRQGLALSATVRYQPLESTALLGLGATYKRLGEESRALETLTDASRIAIKLGSKRLEAEILAELGDCHLTMKRAGNAKADFARSLEIAGEIRLPEVQLAARRGLAEVARRNGDYEEALQHLESAIATLETMRGRIPTADLRAGLVQENWRVYEEVVDVLSVLQQQDATKGYDRRAYYYAEKGHSRSLLDTLGQSAASITKGLSTEQVKRQAELYAELSRASAALLKADSGQNKQAFEQADRSLSMWVADIRATNPDYLALRYPEPLSLEKVQAELGAAGTVILEYSLGERRSHLWAIAKTRTKMVSLPGRPEMEASVRRFRGMIAKPPKGAQALQEYQKQAMRLYEMLIGPVGDYLPGAQRLIIVPDGILHYLPFETLLRGGVEDKPRYLIEDFSIAYAPSASILASLIHKRVGEEDGPRLELLAYGDPVFKAEPAGAKPLESVVRGVYRAAGISFPRLPNTGTEVRSIAGLFPSGESKVFLRREATEESVKHEDLREYRRIHFATHAVIDEQAPARSGVVLSLVDNGKEDGILRMSEIFNLDIGADVVVLSACQTGLGKLVKGEGMVGMTRAFLYAGASRVVVSLWEVNDMAVPEFMRTFYERMERGESASSALRQAKLEMVRSDAPLYRHPYYWAPFVVVGAL